VVAVAVLFTAAAACFAADAHVGTWKLNEGKSKLASGLGKNSKEVYAETKNNMKVTWTA